MNQRTLQMLQKLGSIPWFASVGQPTTDCYLTVLTWQDAVDSCASDIWSSVQLQVKNRIAREVRQKHYDRSEEWNEIAAELRSGIAAIVANSVEPLAKKLRLKPDFQGAVSWDILMICMETEFSDVTPPMFFVPRLEPIYTAGHFPCGWDGPKVNEGWEGALPLSRLMVF